MDGRNAMFTRALWGVIDRREMEVLGEVPADGRSYFCVPEPAGGATYRLTVAGADSMPTTGQ
jgi:hypothetical protein